MDMEESGIQYLVIQLRHWTSFVSPLQYNTALLVPDIHQYPKFTLVCSAIIQYQETDREHNLFETAYI